MGNKKNSRDIEKKKQEEEKTKITVKEKKKIGISIIISIILSIITEFVIISESNSIPRMLTICGIIVFISLHFILGFKKLYDLIIENRFKISIIMIVVSTIIGFLQSGDEIQNWLLNTNTVLSLWWNIKFYSLLLVTYQLFYLITNEKRYYSIVGTIVIAFSGAVQWNFDKIDSLILGELIVVLLYKVLNEESISKKSIYLVGIALSVVGYVYTFIGYAVSFGYVFLALIIWVFLENKEKLKDKKTVCIIVSTILVSIICAIIAIKIVPNNYNDVNEEEIRGVSTLYSYIYNLLLPFNELENKQLCGSFFSLFPTCLFIVLYYVYKNDDHLNFLLPATIIMVIETVFSMSGFHGVIGKISLFDKVSFYRAIAGVNLIGVYVVFYMLSNINKKVFSVVSAIRITILLMCSLAIIKYPIIFATTRYLTIFAIEFCITTFLFLVFDEQSYKKVFLFFITVFVLIGGITVNPIIKIDKNINQSNLVSMYTRIDNLKL